MLNTSPVFRIFGRSPAKLTQGTLLLACLMASLSCSTGCTLMHNAHKAMTHGSSWNEGVVVMRNRNWSSMAWHKRKHRFCGQRHMTDYCSGFRKGYEDVAGGSNGCTPAFPPQDYWGWEYQSGEGQARTSAWFAGYPEGARAAEEDGIGNWTHLQVGGMQPSTTQTTGAQASGGTVTPTPTSNSLPNPASPARTIIPGQPTVVPVPDPTP